MIVTTGDVRGTLAVFTELLGLAEAWPCTTWMVIDEGAAAGGGCNIGVGHAADPPDAPARLAAVAIDPSVDPEAARDAVAARGFRPSALLDSGVLAVPDEEAFRPWNAGWTDMAVEDWGSLPAPFACSYRHDRLERRRREAERFEARGGGPLGITGVAAIVLHDPEPDDLRARWLRLLAPGPTVDGEAIVLGDGPRLEIRSGAPGGALVFGTASLDAAVDALAARSVDVLPVPGSTVAAEVRIDPAATVGLDLRLR